MMQNTPIENWISAVEEAVLTLPDDPILGTQSLSPLVSSVPIVENQSGERQMDTRVVDLLDVLTFNMSLLGKNYLISQVIYAYWAPAYFAVVDLLKAYFAAEKKIPVKDLPEYRELKHAKVRVSTTCEILNYQAILPPEFFEMGY